MNILVVDDDRFMRGMLFQMLNNIGKHEVSLLTNGHNAVSLLADPSHGFDLVFIDLRMPRLSGDKVIEIIQDIVRVEFIMLTGHPEAFHHPPKNLKIVKKPVEYSQIEKFVNDAEKRLKAHAHHKK